MHTAAAVVLGGATQFSSSDDRDDPQAGRYPFRPAAAARDELPFKVELWDNARQSVEMTLAIAAHGAIAYAAFYAAAKEHPHRYITLRHNNKILTRWSGGH
jgi:hypothetical protein